MSDRFWPDPGPSARDGELRLRPLGLDDRADFLRAVADPSIRHFGYHDRFEFDESNLGEFFELFRTRAEAGEGV